jgi:uncharacterized membrane protein YdcZ (DUF606 family)
MRFESAAALAIGVLLPALETYRRGLGHWGVEFTSMFEDYLAGALLLAAAWASFRRHRSEFAMLLLAWAWVTGMMTVSFVDQVEVTVRGVDLEPMNTDVLIVKFLLLSTSAAALLKSYRRAGGLIPGSREMH